MAAPVVIGFDGSPAAERVVREAANLLGPRPALVVVVWEATAAYEPFELPGDLAPAPLNVGNALETEHELYEGARRLAARGAMLAREAGFEAEPLAVADEHTVADTLVHVADDRGAAAIVVGAHGRKGVERILLGSTSEGVMRRSTRPVVVVRDAD